MAEAMEGRAVVTVKLRGGETVDVIVREATVGELRSYLASLPKAGTLLDEALLRDLRVIDLPLFTSLTNDQIEQCRPSQLRKVVDSVRELNPDFFGLLRRTHEGRAPEIGNISSPSSTTPA